MADLKDYPVKVIYGFTCKERPDDASLEKLKAAGFKWRPSDGAIVKEIGWKENQIDEDFLSDLLPTDKATLKTFGARLKEGTVITDIEDEKKNEQA